MMPMGHVAVSTAVAAGVQLATGDCRMSLAAWLVGVLVDLDHIPEYTIFSGRPLRIRSFVRFCAESRMTRMRLLLHGYEFLLLIALVAWLADAPRWGAVIGVAYLSHLLADQFANPVRPGAYFLTYRIYHRFAVEAVIDTSSPVLAARRARYASPASSPTPEQRSETPMDEGPADEYAAAIREPAGGSD